ncbi:MAG: hypothetical protein HY738_03545 [Bacteroidia bacterium]|nr:hypothetical protein [Bacteroidia bacterium]
MDEKNILQIIQEAFNSLLRSGMIPKQIIAIPETIVLGKDSEMDSISLITFFSELEDRFSLASGKEIFLMLNEIHEFNIEKSYLTVSVLVKYIEHFLNKQ